MQYMKNMIFLMLIVVVGTSITNIVPYDLVMETFFEHICDRPKPVAVAVSDLLEENDNEDLRSALLYHPSYVVLHRCGGSGCCQNRDEQCLSSEYEELNLEIAYLPNPDYMETTYLLVRNDTSCECVGQ